MRRYYGLLVVCAVILLLGMNGISAAECDFNWSAMGSPNGAVYAITRSGNTCMSAAISPASAVSRPITLLNGMDKTGLL